MIRRTMLTTLALAAVVIAAGWPVAAEAQLFYDAAGEIVRVPEEWTVPPYGDIIDGIPELPPGSGPPEAAPTGNGTASTIPEPASVVYLAGLVVMGGGAYLVRRFRRK